MVMAMPVTLGVALDGCFLIPDRPGTGLPVCVSTHAGGGDGGAPKQFLDQWGGLWSSFV